MYRLFSQNLTIQKGYKEIVRLRIVNTNEHGHHIISYIFTNYHPESGIIPNTFTSTLIHAKHRPRRCWWQQPAWWDLKQAAVTRSRIEDLNWNHLKFWVPSRRFDDLFPTPTFQSSILEEPYDNTTKIRLQDKRTLVFQSPFVHQDSMKSGIVP